ncbi:MAG: hypothetical protein H6737_27845 [Alphaproteobacteria bacterium]|nr:hypothetical protein [Alphaproteobacteria bacterium]
MQRVYLVPGFFGFANLGDLRYFGHVHRLLGERFAAAGVEASIHEVPTRPTASLKRRAQRLHETIAATATPGDTIHLVGHSSGGLDCRLLTSPGVQIDIDVEPFASSVKSVVTVSTPHRGTPSAAAFSTLAGKRLLRLLSLMTMVIIRQGRVPLTMVLGIGNVVRRLEGLLDDEQGIEDEIFAGLLSELDDERRGQITTFFGEIGEDQALLAQIAPDAMDAFNTGTIDRPDVRYGAVLTRARRPNLKGVLEAGASPYAQASNALYVACHHLAGAGGPAFTATTAALNSYWPDLTESDNDGMVPTASQPWGETIAAVDADHLDVIGHFSGDDAVPPHYDWIRTGTGYRRAAFEATWDAVFAFLLQNGR